MIHIAKGYFNFNDYKIEEDYAVLYLVKKDGRIFETQIDLEDLEKAKAFQRRWCARLFNYCDTPYAICNYYYTDESGKSQHTTIPMQRFVLDVTDPKIHVDHRDNNPLNNRKYNLRQTNTSSNAQNRKGANSNNQTGVRNVNLVTRYGGKQLYLVQIMREGEKFKWEFELDEFEEAVKFAEIKRKEIFGEFAGNG